MPVKVHEYQRNNEISDGDWLRRLQMLDDLHAILLRNDPVDIGQHMALLISRLLEVRRLGPECWQRFRDHFADHDVCHFLRADPITGRAAGKPRGYAGDAELIDLIYFGWPGELSVDRAGAKAIYDYVHSSPSCAAVRYRREVLANRIDAIASRVDGPTIFAIAAGHLREASLSRAFRDGKVGRMIALDQDPDSLSEIARCHPVGVEILHNSVKDLLTGEVAIPPVDLIYAAGLYDYLPDAVAKRLTRVVCRQLKPGGVFLFANFTADVVDAGYMESAMDWHLILRTSAQMAQIAAACGEDYAIRHWTDAYSAIHYCEISRKD